MQTTEAEVDSRKSIVTEVLFLSDDLKKNDIEKCMLKLKKKIEKAKLSVDELLEQRYKNFNLNVQCKSIQSLDEDIQKCLADLETSGSNLELLKQNVTLQEFEEMKSTLNQANSAVYILNVMMKLHKLIVMAEKHLHAEKFKEASTCISEMEEEFRKLETYKHLKILLHFRRSINFIKCNVEVETVQLWKKMVCHKCSILSDATIVSMSLPHQGQKFDDVFQTLYSLQCLPGLMDSFSDFLLNNVFAVIINKDLAEVSCDTLPNSSYSLTVRHPTKSVKKREFEVNGVGDCFDKLMMCIKFLCNEPFNGVARNDEGESFRTVEEIGKRCSEQLIVMIQDEVLKLAVPRKASDLESFTKIIDEIGTFEQFLHNCQFTPEDNCSLSTYVSNINLLFTNKKSEDLLTQTRELLKKDLHETFTTLDEGTSTAKNGEKVMSLHDNTLRFPSTVVSKSVESLLLLANQTLEEIAACDAESRPCLFYAVRNMFELYCAIVPTYHKKAIAELPQITAIYHNNCMYVSHTLLLFGHLYSPSFADSDVVITFCDFVPQIQSMGADALLEQVQRQQKIIDDLLLPVKGFQSSIDCERNLDIQRSIKQVIHTLKFLHNVWKDTMHEDLLEDTLCMLIDGTCKYVVNCIVILEDISTTEAHQLHSFCEDLTTKLRHILPFDNEDCRKSSYWTQAVELQFILNCSLQDIEDRWAGGSGPLASIFEGSQVRNLVRAIFQNTEQRSKLIKYLTK